MDKLSIGILISSFLFCGPLYTLIIMALNMFFDKIEFNYKSLFLLWFSYSCWMFTYVELLINVFNSCILLCCVMLYWYNIDYEKLETYPYMKTILNNMQREKEKYKMRLYNILVNITNINKKKLIHYEKQCVKYYTYVSLSFDNFCDMVYDILCKIHNLTKDMPGIRYMYNMYDMICIYIHCIEMLKSTKRHKTSNKPQSIFSTANSSNSSNSVHNISVDTNNILNNNTIFDMVNNMTPDEKKQMDNMTKDFMKNFNIDKLMDNIIKEQNNKKFD
jgi:hypothetical protein